MLLVPLLLLLGIYILFILRFFSGRGGGRGCWLAAGSIFRLVLAVALAVALVVGGGTQTSR